MPDLASPVEARIGLNRSERVYLALEGVAGALGQVHVLRFVEPHAEAELRAALRDLVRRCPRLRARVERGHRLAVLAEGASVDRLFEQAFRVVPAGADAASLQQLLDELVNEPFALERALPLRARLLTGAARPILVLSLHHVACDGRGMIALLEALMARLNGQHDGAPMPIDDPSMLPAILPPASWPLARRVGSLWRSYRAERRERSQWRGTRTLSLVKEGGAFGPTGVRLHAVPVALEAIKAAASGRDCTVTELVVAALCASFATEVESAARAIASVRVSVDLRPFFEPDRRPQIGNYVAAIVVRVTKWDDLEATVEEVRAQLREATRRLENKELSVPLLRAELAPRLLGRRLFAWCARMLKRRGRLQQVTLHVSNLGGVDQLNAHGERARLSELAFFTPALGPYVGCVGLAGRLCLGVTYPRDEVEGAAIDRALAGFDRGLAKLCRLRE